MVVDLHRVLTDGYLSSAWLDFEHELVSMPNRREYGGSTPRDHAINWIIGYLGECCFLHDFCNWTLINDNVYLSCSGDLDRVVGAPDFISTKDNSTRVELKTKAKEIVLSQLIEADKKGTLPTEFHDAEIIAVLDTHDFCYYQAKYTENGWEMEFVKAAENCGALTYLKEYVHLRANDGIPLAFGKYC